MDALVQQQMPAVVGARLIVEPELLAGGKAVGKRRQAGLPIAGLLEMLSATSSDSRSRASRPAWPGRDRNSGTTAERPRRTSWADRPDSSLAGRSVTSVRCCPSSCSKAGLERGGRGAATAQGQHATASPRRPAAPHRRRPYRSATRFDAHAPGHNAEEEHLRFYSTLGRPARGGRKNGPVAASGSRTARRSGAFGTKLDAAPQRLGAGVELHPVMVIDDLAKASGHIEKAVKKYA